MNWNLISKDEDGETQIHLFWVCLLISLFGFLFGLGFSVAYLVVESVLNGDGLVYTFIEDNRVFVVIATGLLAWAVYLLITIQRKVTKNEKG